jgi:hypothetical protein
LHFWKPPTLFLLICTDGTPEMFREILRERVAFENVEGKAEED